MRNRYVLLGDLALIATAAFGAFALRFDWLFLSSRPEFWSFLVAALVVKPPILGVFGMYRRYWRYATASDLLSVTLAVSATSVVLALYVALYVGLGQRFGFSGEFSRPVLLIDWLLSLAVLGGLRMSVRVVGEAHQQKSRRAAMAGSSKRVIIAGAGEAGAMVVRELQRNPQLGMIPVGFLDDAHGKHGNSIGGVRVLGPIADLQRVVAAESVAEVIIAMPAAGGSSVRTVSELCRLAGVESQIVPGVFEMLDGQISVSRLRSVEITDLLRRSHRAPGDGDVAAQYVDGKTVLVTGAGGSIGQELCRQIAHAQPAALVLLGHGENSIFDVQAQLRREFASVTTHTVIADIRDARRIDAVFAAYRPDVVLHAAAHKHVPLMEENPVEAVSNNVLGTYIVASAAVRFHVQRFVLISTDKAVAPTSFMGATKRMAELIVRALAGRHSTKFMVVRFGNVLGSRGSVVPIFKAQIERGGPVIITHRDMKRFFMTIPEAVNLVLRAGALGRGGELFVLNMGEAVKISDLAEDLIKLSGFELEEIPIIYSGLRPGEKLEEVLWEPGATVQPTAEPDVLQVIDEHQSSGASLDAMLDLFHAAVHAGDRSMIEGALLQFVPTFTPTASTAASVQPRP